MAQGNNYKLIVPDYIETYISTFEEIKDSDSAVIWLNDMVRFTNDPDGILKLIISRFDDNKFIYKESYCNHQKGSVFFYFRFVRKMEEGYRNRMSHFSINYYKSKKMISNKSP